MAIRLSRGHMEPHFGGRGGHKGSAMAPSERAMVVSYRLSVVIVALSQPICNHLATMRANVSDAQINRGFGPKFPGVPIGVDHLMFGSAESEHPRLINGEIIW